MAVLWRFRERTEAKFISAPRETSGYRHLTTVARGPSSRKRDMFSCIPFPFLREIQSGSYLGPAHSQIFAAMNPDNLRARFAGLQVWERKGQRAPNKPLLALWAIGRCLRAEDRMASYRDAERALTYLLCRFGRPRKQVHPEFPFWRMRNDSLWEVQGTGPITEGPGGDVHVTSLRREDARGGFPPDVFAALQADEALAFEIACSLVDAHFPATLHDDVLEAVGIGSRLEYVRRRARDSTFSRTVLIAYGHQCAVCEFGVRLNGEHVALEGAHIRWHRARGPDQVRNGLALCALHHRLFDAGAFTVSLERRIVVSTAVHGEGFDDSLGRFHQRSVSLPASDDDLPDPNFLKWHHREVFGSIPSIVCTSGRHAG